jgi:hypothetical protein
MHGRWKENWKEQYESDFINYCRMMPIPDAFVILKTDIETLWKNKENRVLNRRLESKEIVGAIDIINRDISEFPLSEKSEKENGIKISQFLTQLYSKHPTYNGMTLSEIHTRAKNIVGGEDKISKDFMIEHFLDMQEWMEIMIEIFPDRCFIIEYKGNDYPSEKELRCIINSILKKRKGDMMV